MSAKERQLNKRSNYLFDQISLKKTEGDFKNFTLYWGKPLCSIQSATSMSDQKTAGGMLLRISAASALERRLMVEDILPVSDVIITDYDLTYKSP